MEEIASTVAVPFRIGNLIQKESTVTTHMEITGLKLMANKAAAALMLNPSIEDCQSYSVGIENHTDVSPKHKIKVPEEIKDNHVGADLGSEMVTEYESNWVLNETHNKYIIDDEILLANNFHRVHNPKSQSAASDKNCLWEESSTLATNCSNIDLPITTKVDNINGKLSLTEPHAELEPVQNMALAAKELEIDEGSGSDGSDLKQAAMFHEMPEMKTSRTSCQDTLELSGVGPHWGFSSVCGRRQEMEDAISVKPQVFQVSSSMLIDDHVSENKNSQAHFFGVYDGHGGCQVANYCRDNLHSVLVEEIGAAESNLSDNNRRDNWQDHWRKAFSNCYRKVDYEVGGVQEPNGESNIDDGSESSIQALIPETAGSTAVVAILSQTHIIVANCGDSRAVLCRRKEAVPLSTDHKPNREDEWDRIEAAGGRVIQWNGYRVLGVLAVSRSIGDRYLKPWIIPDPEVMFVQREKNDECLILASDGLWDVITNEEACDIARKRILIWHKKNCNNNNNVPNTGQVHGVDPAAQSAAEYLSKLALQRGSNDNISVIVIDLKEQRKIKGEA